MIFGVGAVLRLLFAEALGGGAWVFGLCAVPFAIALAFGIGRSRRDRA